MSYMKQKAGLSNCGSLTMIDWALDYQIRKQIEDYLLKLVIDNDYKTATVIAPGRKWKDFVEQLADIVLIDKIYDKDPGLEDWCTIADPIFDDVDINTDVTITLHGEKLYPPTRMFPGDHILLVAPHYHHLDCTKEDQLDLEEENMDAHYYGDYLLYHGRVLANGK